MVYYNPDDEGLEYILHDVQIAFEMIDKYEKKYLKFPKQRVSKELELEISQKREGLRCLKEYILEHQFDMSMMDILDAFVCKMWNMTVQSQPNSEARVLFFNMYKVGDDIIGYFL